MVYLVGREGMRENFKKNKCLVQILKRREQNVFLNCFYSLNIWKGLEGKGNVNII